VPCLSNPISIGPIHLLLFISFLPLVFFPTAFFFPTCVIGVFDANPSSVILSIVHQAYYPCKQGMPCVDISSHLPVVDTCNLPIFAVMAIPSCACIHSSSSSSSSSMITSCHVHISLSLPPPKNPQNFSNIFLMRPNTPISSVKVVER